MNKYKFKQILGAFLSHNVDSLVSRNSFPSDCDFISQHFEYCCIAGFCLSGSLHFASQKVTTPERRGEPEPVYPAADAALINLALMCVRVWVGANQSFVLFSTRALLMSSDKGLHSKFVRSKVCTIPALYVTFSMLSIPSMVILSVH